ncbi:hypothetical protein [Oceanomicrobium pacificus]|uniref:FlgO domain-containing protein n=1 Tax=Oceanomicrobium pacificus TaxID=2692916 RepID=A0A6B0U008_9RHOB|nr:hypothetical protein [Oceanomicrobium pacificus]MXU66564.1 hypothetical protein [Oceanomicrobium pacificus]
MIGLALRRALALGALLLPIAQPAAALDDAEQRALFAELEPCLTDAFRIALDSKGAPARLREMIPQYFNLASVAAMKYGGANFNRASNKGELMDHAAAVLEEQIAENLWWYEGRAIRFNAASLKEIRPKGRYSITGRVEGDEAFGLRVSRDGPMGCEIHALFYGGLSIADVMNGQLIRY